MPHPFKIPESVLVVIYTPALDVLLIRRTEPDPQAPVFWQSVTGSKDTLDEPFALTAAREVLEQRGLWPAMQDKLALGDNAAQAAQFAASGAAQAGLIPLSLARAPELAARGAYVTLPETWHTPLRQTLVLVKGAGPTARAFAEFLRGPQAREILARNGFGLPAP